MSLGWNALEWSSKVSDVLGVTKTKLDGIALGIL